MATDYSPVSETPGDEITREAASMLVTRYEQASRLSGARHVLEVGCGSGQGLGYLARGAARVVGGDTTDRLLRIAQDHYGARIPLVHLDAQHLPFRSAVFDVIVLHEAIYYLRTPQAFVTESRRVLRDGGSLVISTINREWPGFNPSPHSHWYPTARELRALLMHSFSRVEIYGAFPSAPAGAAAFLISIVRRAAVRLGLIPKTMRGKRVLKRLFFGGLMRVPREITPEFAPAASPVMLTADRRHPEFKVLSAVASAS